jgi:hypothetical protein
LALRINDAIEKSRSHPFVFLESVPARDPSFRRISAEVGGSREQQKIMIVPERPPATCTQESRPGDAEHKPGLSFTA